MALIIQESPHRAIKDFRFLRHYETAVPSEKIKIVGLAQVSKLTSTRLYQDGQKDPVGLVQISKKCLIKEVSVEGKDTEKLFKDVRKYMNIRDEKDLGEMNDYELFRDAYLTGLICNVGDMTDNGERVRRGTNYVTIVTESGDYQKVWLKKRY